MLTHDEHEILREYTNPISFNLYIEIMKFLDMVNYKDYENEISRILDNESTLRGNIGLMTEVMLKEELNNLAEKFTLVFSEETSIMFMFNVIKHISTLQTLDTYVLVHIRDIVTTASDLDNIEKLADILEVGFSVRQQDVFDYVVEIDSVVFDVIETAINERSMIDVSDSDILLEITRTRLSNFLKQNISGVEDLPIYHLLQTLDMDYHIGQISKTFRSDISSSNAEIARLTCISILVFFSHTPSGDLYKYMTEYLNTDNNDDIIQSIIIFMKENEDKINSIRGL